jgi:glycosyltransferase involved in cell wall biosynthesis/UDP-N-acetylglucosamine transferase subunit ALG13
MIFVATGTTDFNTLVRKMDELSLSLDEEVVMQIGRSSYVPKNCQHFRYAPSLVPYYEQASVVISHGGLGILTEVMALGKPLISIEDPNQPDRHQQQLLQIWSEQNHLIWCKELSDLPDAIKRAKTELVPYEVPESSIHIHIKEYLEQSVEQSSDCLSVMHSLKTMLQKIGTKSDWFKRHNMIQSTNATKRVCVIRLSTYFGDMSVQREVATLHEAGYETHVICMDEIPKNRKKEPNYQRELIVDGIHVYRMPTRRKKEGLSRYAYDYLSFFFLAGLKVTKLHRQHPFDVIQVNTMPDFLVFATLVPKLLGAKIVVVMQEPVPELWQTMRFTPAPRPIKWIEQAALAYVDRTFTVTQQLKDAYVSRGANPDKISVILNVPAMSFLLEHAVDTPPVEPNHFTLVCHGAIEERYGHDTMLEAVALVKSKIPEIRLRIMGMGSYEDEFVTQISRLGLENHVDFLGWVTLAQMVQEIQAADVGIVAQKSSPYSNLVQTNKMYEYIAFNKPVLATRLKAVEAYFSSDALQFFEPNNPESLAEQILYLYRNPARRQTLVENARRLYELYKWDKQKLTYLSVYQELATR